MKIEYSQTIHDFGTIDPAFIQFFIFVELVIIDICRKVVEVSGGIQSGD